MLPYVARSGEFLSKIAHARCFDADEVWNHPKNATLKEQRKDSNVLAPGDVLFIPPEKKRGLALTNGTRTATSRKYR